MCAGSQQRKAAKTGETATVNLSASLNSDSESIVESAEVKISLTRQEASALQQFRDENGKLDYETEVLSGEGTAINIELKERRWSKYLLYIG